ncbi:MAG: class I SAM-dependent methyltransferase [Deltaproteobacteria bacterium]|nr:class I SAM-dependent methyltransferase [Deltaproteobacteria bacterium]
MGLIFDIRAARLYESWYKSPKGKLLDTFFESLVPTLMEPRQGEKVLDIGCGSGNQLLCLSKLALDIYGIDASPYMISLARERLGNRCSLKTGMAEDLPFEDNEFDVALLVNSLEFIDDPVEALREAARVTKRKIFIVALNSLSFGCLAGKMHGLIGKSIMNHARPYSLWGLKKYIRTALGNVPIEWECSRTWPFHSGTGFGRFLRQMSLDRCLMGSLIGISATIKYTVKTNNVPLKVSIGKTRESVIGGINFERSLPL